MKEKETVTQAAVALESTGNPDNQSRGGCGREHWQETSSKCSTKWKISEKPEKPDHP